MKPKTKPAAKRKQTRRKKQAMDKLTYVSNHPRSVLTEGRNYGLGFGFAKKEGNVLTSVMPISPCKDYLNDVVYTEKTGNPYSAFGLKTTKTGCFEDGNAYLVMSVCLMGARISATYSTYEKDKESLAQNVGYMQEAINWFEEKFGVNGRTKIEKIEDNLYVAIAPLFWTEATYLISLYSLILRCAMEKSSGPAMEVLTNNAPSGDYGSAKAAVPNVEQMLGGKIPKQDMSVNFGVHNCGIVNFKF